MNLPSIEFAGVFTSIVNQKSTAPNAFGGEWRNDSTTAFGPSR
jgi:hypothetical protein